MSIAPSRWRSGFPDAHTRDIPVDDACVYCAGSGEEIVEHVFGKGRSYIPCFHCDGTGLHDPDKYDHMPYKSVKGSFHRGTA